MCAQVHSQPRPHASTCAHTARESARACAREREREEREKRERDERERERERETHAPHALNTRTHIHRRTRAARRRGGDSKGGWGKKRQAEERGRAPGICVRSKLVSAQMCTYYICIDIHAGALLCTRVCVCTCMLHACMHAYVHLSIHPPIMHPSIIHPSIRRTRARTHTHTHTHTNSASKQKCTIESFAQLSNVS